MRKTIEVGGLEYQVCKTGKVFGPKRGELKQRKNSDGYLMVTVGINERRTATSVHGLVAKLFVDGHRDGLEVNHIDLDRTNNHYSNLEWVTHAENVRHSADAGRYTGRAGEDNGRSILTDGDIPKIKEMYQDGVPIAHIARAFGVGWTTISHVLKNNTWRHCISEGQETISDECN